MLIQLKNFLFTDLFIDRIFPILCISAFIGLILAIIFGISKNKFKKVLVLVSLTPLIFIACTVAVIKTDFDSYNGKKEAKKLVQACEEQNKADVEKYVNKILKIVKKSNDDVTYGDIVRGVDPGRADMRYVIGAEVLYDRGHDFETDEIAFLLGSHMKYRNEAILLLRKLKNEGNKEKIDYVYENLRSFTNTYDLDVMSIFRASYALRDQEPSLEWYRNNVTPKDFIYVIRNDNCLDIDNKADNSRKYLIELILEELSSDDASKLFDCFYYMDDDIVLAMARSKHAIAALHRVDTNLFDYKFDENGYKTTLFFEILKNPNTSHSDWYGPFNDGIMFHSEYEYLEDKFRGDLKNSGIKAFTARDSDGNTVWHHAAQDGDEILFNVLSNYFIKVVHDYCPEYSNAEYGDFTVAAFKMKNNDGDTPLHIALNNVHEDSHLYVVEQLIKGGSDPYAVDGSGKSSFELLADTTPEYLQSTASALGIGAKVFMEDDPQKQLEMIMAPETQESVNRFLESSSTISDSIGNIFGK